MTRDWLRRGTKILCAAALTAGVVALPGGSASAANVLANSGFESGLSGWSCTSGQVVSSPTHSGSGALAGTPAGQDNARCEQTVSVVPNSQYTLSGWVQGGFVFIGASGTGTGDVSTWTASAPSFTQLTTGFTTGPQTTSVTVFVHGWFGQPQYFADDIVLDGEPGDGNPGDPGDEVPDTPGGLGVTGTTTTSVSLSWDDVAEPVDGYNVYRNGSVVDTVADPTAVVGGLAPGTTHTFSVSAFNEAGESARSASVTATTESDGGGGDPGDGGPLPRHFLTGYWQNFVNGATPLRLTDVPRGYDLVAVAFAESTTTPGQVTFDVDSALSNALGGYSNQDLAGDVDTLHQQNRSVILSVGGALGTVRVDSPAAANNFANSVFDVMQEFGFDGVDIDLENGVNPTFMSQALHQLASMVGPDLVVTMAPQTLDMQSTGRAYFQLALNIRDILTVVHTQYYNSGTMLGCDQGVYGQTDLDFMTALACIQLENGLSPDQVALGKPASPRAAGGGFVNPAQINDALDCLARATNCGDFTPPRTYPGIRGAMTWSINWDASNGFRFVNTVAPHLDTLP